MTTGPLLENVYRGDDINLTKIPAPKWHEHDGGYYIGTGGMVIMRDPDTGWINYGAYRVQVHDEQRRLGDVLEGQARRHHHAPLPRARRALPDRGGVRHASGAVHGRRARNSLRQERIRRRRRPARRAGRGDPGPATGLPIPANAEIAFEGFVSPDDLIDEGPLGEWTGYYAGGLKKEPAIRVESFMHRNDPILLGAIPGMPPDDDTFYRGTYRCGAVWNQLEAAGVPGGEGRVGARGRRQPAVAHRLDQADVSAAMPSRRA